MIKTFLRPGWIALAIVVVAFAALCFSLLAPWQLGKNSATEHRNELIKSAVATAPVPIDTVAPGGSAFDPSTEWREVRLTGRYLDDHEVLARLRSVGERPAIEVLTPFAVDGSSRVILVDRGFVRPDQSAIPSVAPAPSGAVTIDGRIRKSEGTSPGRGLHDDGGIPAVYTIDPAEVSTATSMTLDPFYLQLSPGQPGSLGEIPLPQLDSGPYLSYGLQWLAFGVMAPLGAGYFIYSEVRARRAAKAQNATLGDGPDNEPGDLTPAAAGPSIRPETSRQRVRAGLRDAGTSNESVLRGEAIGHGPVTDDDVADDVRTKLSERYGR